MPVQLNHTIVWAGDAARSAAFLAEILGLPPPVRFGPFHGVEVGNGVTLDFMTSTVRSPASTTRSWPGGGPQ